MSTQFSTEQAAQYAALTTAVGLVDVSDRTQLELTGADRAQFLHNLSTNHVRDLAPGAGCETFFLNVKGHVIGHAFIFSGPASQVIETVPQQASALIGHLDRYLIREEVQLRDRSAEWGELLLAGPEARSTIERLRISPLEVRLAHAQAQLAGQPLWIRRVDLLTPEDYALAMPRGMIADAREAIRSAGAIDCGSSDVADTVRIERGMPLFGRDITADNLPQEIDRDGLAISFTKGCYLGQETVARIDALGHVNRLLRGVKLDAKQIPAPGIELRSAGKTIGQITSACWSVRLGAPLALAYVRRGYHDPGTRLETETGAAEIVALPLPS